MEFPFGHHRRAEEEVEEERERRRREEDEYQPPPPGHHHHHPPQPDPYGGFEERYSAESSDYSRPPPRYERPGGEHEEYYGEDIYGQRRPHAFGYGVQHVSHEVSQEGAYDGGHEEGSYEASGGGRRRRVRTVRVFTKAKEDFSLTIRDGKVVLAPSDPNDEYQHWIKDERYSTKVKDAEGLPSFSLINKVTGEAIKHSIGATHPVRLVPYNPDYLDQSILWAESNDTGEDFRCIRMVNNIELNFDAFNGDKDHGGVRDGTIIVLWEWAKGENQRWKIVPY